MVGKTARHDGVSTSLHPLHAAMHRHAVATVIHGRRVGHAPGPRVVRPARDVGGDRRHLPTNRYWQAMTVVDHLLITQPAQMPAVFQALRASGSIDLLPHLGPVLGTDLAAFEAEWSATTTARYGAPGSR